MSGQSWAARHILQRFAPFFIYAAVALCASACSDSARPPFIKAQVTDVYNRKTELYNAHFAYWWQERGETAFLDTHERTTRMFMACRLLADSLNGDCEPFSISLEQFDAIDWQLSAEGKKMRVHLSSGEVFEALSIFPRTLLNNRDAGLADFRCFITGSTTGDRGAFDYRQDINFLREIRFASDRNRTLKRPSMDG